MSPLSKKPTICIDVDGVLRDNLKTMVDLYNKSFGESLKVCDVLDFRTEISFPKIEKCTDKTASEWLFQDHSKEIFLEAGPYPHVNSDIESLRKEANVVILTYQKTYRNQKHTLEWLWNNKIEYDGLVFMKDKTRLICDYFVDDNSWNFIGSNAKHGILISAPYNLNESEESVLKTSNCEDIVRCESLHEFTVNYLENIR